MDRFIFIAEKITKMCLLRALRWEGFEMRTVVFIVTGSSLMRLFIACCAMMLGLHSTLRGMIQPRSGDFTDIFVTPVSSTAVSTLKLSVLSVQGPLKSEAFMTMYSRWDPGEDSFSVEM